MSTQFFLDESDIETLTKLMLRSQRFRAREVLCLRIGIDSTRLWFIKDSSDSDFVVQLINHLNEIGNREALCKLCCEEIFPVFCNGTYAPILSDMAAKLQCNQVLNHNYSNISSTQNLIEPNNRSIFGKVLAAVTGLAVLLGGGALFYSFVSKSQQLPSGTYPTTCKNISVDNGILTGTCIDFNGQLKKSSLEFKQCNYGV